MVGIVSYGAYVPLWRLDLAEAKKGKGEKAVANFDEDSVTMAVAASIDCLTGRNRDEVEGLYFATTTAPYGEKQAATVVATAVDLPAKLFTADLTDSLKAGTTAFRMAADAVAAGTAKQVLVAAADLRKASPGSAYEGTYGDGAAALLLGDEGVIARVEGSYSVATEIHDNWRGEGESYVHSAEDRFILDKGFTSATRGAIKGLMDKLGLAPQDFAKVAFSAPDARSHADVARRLEFAPEQVEDSLFGKVGSAGAAHALMVLVGALEKAKPGDRILLAGFGNGADAVSLVVTEEIEKLPTRRGLAKHLETKRTVDYQSYLYWRDIVKRSPAAARPVKIPSTHAMWREQEQVLRFHGGRCKACGKIQYPAQRVCSYCQEKDNYESVTLADKKAEIFTYSMDYIGGSKDVPLVVTIVDFEGGGRAMLQMTDRAIADVRVGMPLELSFRHLKEVHSIRNYYWKTIPVRA